MKKECVQENKKEYNKEYNKDAMSFIGGEA